MRQRAFAMLNGLGIIVGNCEDESMINTLEIKKLLKKNKKLMNDFDEKNKSL